MPLDHNFSAVRFPDGYTRNQLKESVQLCASLTERERILLFYVLDQADSWTYTVQHIRSRMQWGEDRWRTVRSGLQTKGILIQEKVTLAKNSHQWRLSFDFVVVSDICKNGIIDSKLSTDTAKTPVSRARTRSPLPPGDHVSLAPGVGSRDPTPGARLTTSKEPKQQPQSAEVVASMLIGKMGLTDAETKRVERAAKGAAHDQIENLADAWRSAKQRPTQPGAGLAIHLAKLAAAGQLEPTNKESCDIDQVQHVESARSVCDRVGGTLVGYILSDPSIIGLLTVLPFGQLQRADGRVYDDRNAAQVWRSVEAGELDCKRLPAA